MKKKLYMFVLILGMFFLIGCAVTDEQIALNYKLGAPKGNIYHVKQNQKISVDVKDGRDDYAQDPTGIVYKTFFTPRYSMDGKGKYLAEKPVNDIVKDALRDGLCQMNMQPVSIYDSRYLLDCTIVKTAFIIESDSTVVLGMALACALIDTKKNKVLWNEIFISRGKSFYDGGYVEADMVIKAFNDALTQLVRKIQESPTFQIILESL